MTILFIRLSEQQKTSVILTLEIKLTQSKNKIYLCYPMLDMFEIVLELQ